MENGSQTKRPLDEKPEEINEKVSKRETMESPVEQKLQREGQDPESHRQQDLRTGISETERRVRTDGNCHARDEKDHG